ncbi:MAG: class II fructose-bisphosphate aldolase [Verrucomicrobiota bacterium]
MRLRTLDFMRAAYGRYALGAFNVSNLEQIHGLFRGADQAHAPVIVQFTRAIRKYADPGMLEGMLQAAEALWPAVMFSVHLDHGDAPTCADAIRSGHYSSVMIDASHHPFEQNIEATAAVVRPAHAAGLAVEAELGQLKGVEDDMEVSARDAILTDPGQAETFVRRSGCDALAVAIGTSHGAYKFAGKQRLHLDRLAEIRKRLPGIPLVLHGGSAVPRLEVERINAAGGRIEPGASGVSEDELAAAIALGIAKVNIGTDGRLIWTRVHREFFAQNPKEFDFMVPGRLYMEEYAQFVASKCQTLGSAGRASELRETLRGHGAISERLPA